MMKMTTAGISRFQQICERGGGPMKVIACDQRGDAQLLATNPEEEAADCQDILGTPSASSIPRNHASCVLLDPYVPCRA